MKTYIAILISLCFIGGLAAQDLPTCDDADPVANQEWEPNPAANTVTLNSTNGYTAFYSFPIVRDRQYFKFDEVSTCGNTSIYYTIYQKPYGDPCSGLIEMESGSFDCPLTAVHEFYVDGFEEGGLYAGYISFSVSFNVIAAVDFAVMYGEPSHPSVNNISIQDFDGSANEMVTTAGMPEDPNVPALGAWFNFNSGSETVLYLKTSYPFPAYAANVGLYDANYTPITSSPASDYYAGGCYIDFGIYTLNPGTEYKIFVYTPIGGPPGQANISLHRPPTDTPNDRMENAVGIAPSGFGGCNYVHGTIKRASVSPQNTACTNALGCCFYIKDDIWYVFTATQPTCSFSIGNIVDHAGDLENIKMSVLSADGSATVGNSCEQFTGEGTSVITDLVPGNQYLLRLAGWNGANPCERIDCEFDFCLTQFDCIQNDDCATAANFVAPSPGNSTNLSGSTLCATSSISGTCNTAPEQDAWWKFTATQTSYNFTLTSFDGVLTDNGGIDLEIAADCDGSTVPNTCQSILLNQTRSVSGLTIGQTYYLRISGGLSEGVFDLSVAAPMLVPQDDCAGSTMIPVSASCDYFSVSTINTSPSQQTSCGNGNNDDLWYDFTPTTTCVRLDEENIVAIQGSVSPIYSGIYHDCANAPIACFTLNETTDQTVSTLTPGATYKVQMFTLGDLNAGTFDVCLQAVSSAVNDVCNTAISVTPSAYNAPAPTTVAVNTQLASGGPNDCFGNPVDDDLWYTFTASSTSYLFKPTNIAINSGSQSFPVIWFEFFEGCGGASTSCFGLYENASRVVAFTPGQTYTYRVWTADESYTAAFDLVQLALPNAPANDYCDAPVVVSVSAFGDPCSTVSGTTLGGSFSDNFECGAYWWDDVYYSFTPAYSNIAVHLNNYQQLWGQSTGLWVQLFSDCLDGLYSFECRSVEDGGSISFANLNTGHTYYLKIWSAGCQECYTSFDICIKEGSPPNDAPTQNFDFDLNSGALITGTTVNASFDATYGLPPCASSSAPIQDVWYFLQNHDHVNADMILSSASSGIKSVIYKGDINSPANLTVLLATCGSGSRNISLVGLETNQYYWLRVWSEGNTAGTFDISYQDMTTATATVATVLPDACTPSTSVMVDGSNIWAGIPVVIGDDPVVVIHPNGNNLGHVAVDYYVSSSTRMDNQGIPYLNRNIAITPQFQPSPGSPVSLRFLLTADDLDALAVSLSGLNTTRVNDQPCSNAIEGAENTLLPQQANGNYLNGQYFELQTDHFSSFYAHGGIIPLQGAALAVELVTFNGESLASGKSQLYWKTATELDNKGFYIEKSEDGKAFYDIGFVSGEGTSLVPSSYRFVDDRFSEDAYYRLRQIDYAGNMEHSNVIFLEIKEVGGTSVFPNPTTSEVTLQYALHQPPFLVQILSNTGQLLSEERVEDASTQMTINVSSFPRGVYWLRVQAEEGVFNHRFYKL